MAEKENYFKVEIITPERIFFTGEAEFIEFCTMSGEIGVYKNHIPMTTVLAPGMVTIHMGEEEKQALVHAGFAEILNDKVTLLAEIAEWPDEIDLDRAEEARDRAQQRLENASEVDIKRAEYALRKALLRIDASKER